MNGAPVGRELGRYAFSEQLASSAGDTSTDVESDGALEDGSVMIVVATNAPLHARNLNCLATRAIMGLARTGSHASNGSGDYVIAFSTHPALRGPRSSDTPVKTASSSNASMSSVFAATVEATEDAIYNAILATHPNVQPKLLTRFEARMPMFFSEGSIGGDIERIPVDGSNPATDRQGIHTVDEIVTLLNPDNGWLQNCNSTPFTAVVQFSPKREDYAYYMAPDRENFRGIHAQRVLTGLIAF